MQLYVIRHGDNLLQSSNKRDGHVDGYIDAGLSDVGWQQVYALAERLPTLVTNIDLLYTSTLRRAQETAVVLGDRYGRAPVGDDRLRELGCNHSDGRPWADDDLPGGFNVAKAVDPFAPVSPAEGQESWHDFRGRVSGFLAELVATHWDQTSVIVCHGGVINAMIDHICNIGLWRHCDILPRKTSVTHIEYRGESEQECWLLHYLGEDDMSSAEKILIVGGIVNLAYGFLTGFSMGVIRQREPVVPKYLTLAHTGPLMQGPMLLGLVFALQLSTLSPVLELVASCLLVAGSFFLATKDTWNWLRGIEDEFREKPTIGMILGGLSVFTATAGLLIMLIGVWQGL